MKYIWIIVKTLLVVILIGLIGVSIQILRTYPFDTITLYLFDVNSNELFIAVEEPLVKEKVKIELLTSLMKLQKRLFKNEDIYSFIFDGRKKHNIVNEYGPYEFTITYDNKYHAKVKHYKYNSHEQYSYSFKFKKKEEDIILEVNFDGIDSLKSILIMERINN